MASLSLQAIVPGASRRIPNEILGEIRRVVCAPKGLRLPNAVLGRPQFNIDMLTVKTSVFLVSFDFLQSVKSSDRLEANKSA